MLKSIHERSIKLKKFQQVIELRKIGKPRKFRNLKSIYTTVVKTSVSPQAKEPSRSKNHKNKKKWKNQPKLIKGANYNEAKMSSKQKLFCKN